jgi:hypothetical protein
MNSKSEKPQKYEILSDHKKDKKLLLPPLLQIPNSQDTSYTRLVLPQFIWLAFLNQSVGFTKARNICELIAEILRKQKWVPVKGAWVSTMQTLNDEARAKLKADLLFYGTYPAIESALKPLLILHGETPLQTIFQLNAVEKSKEPLTEYKCLLAKLLNNQSKETILMLALAEYFRRVIAIDLGLPKSAPMNDLGEIQNFPDSYHSRMLASGLRASNIGFIALLEHHGVDLSWSKQFWKKNFELEEIDYGLIRGESGD